ncbi:MAG TPA: glycosyltransferase [Gemmatimonadales bacterium]|jgi:hypothetical protein
MTAADDRRLQPRLSVVVAAWSGSDELRACLNSLFAAIDATQDEVIVARNFAFTGEPESAAATRPSVDIARHGAAVPELRAAGLARATGSIVAFIEDHCTCGPGWRDAIVAGHHFPVAGVGGPVDLGRGGRPLDWAVYFYDYARFMPPMPAGTVSSLSGANMSWKQSFLAELQPQLQTDVLEVTLMSECLRRGSEMSLAPAAIVNYRKRNAAGPAVRLAFHLARGYAARRVTGHGTGRRLVLAAAAVLLPAVLGARIVASTLRSPRNMGRLLGAAPWLVVLLVLWSLGEGTGYVAGKGDSHGQWR